MPYRGTLLSLFCSSYNNNPISDFFPEGFLGSKLLSKAVFPNPLYNVKLFSLLGSRAIIKDCVNRRSIVSLGPQTLPRSASVAWPDFETIFENLNLVLDTCIRDEKFHR